MTTMEWVLIAEIAVLAMLAVLLVVLVMRSRRKASAAPQNGSALYAGSMGRQPGMIQPGGMPVIGQVGQMPCPGGYPSGSLVPSVQAAPACSAYYGQPACSPYAQPAPAQAGFGQSVPGRNVSSQTAFGANACSQPSYEQTVYGQGTYPGYPPAEGFGAYGMYGAGGNYGASAAGYGYGGMQAGGFVPGSGYIPSPVIGEEKTILVQPEAAGSSAGHKPRKPHADKGSRTDRPQNIQSSKRWRVDFMEMSSGRQVSRDFRNELVVGRQMPAPLESGRLYLSMDATVSRAQFCLFVTEKGIMIENLSKVNVTRKNGYPLWQPVPLEEGDILEMGRMRYMVKGIHQAA